MDIISHYSTYTPARTATAGRNTVNQPIVRGMSSDEFMELMKSQGVKAPDRSKFLYNGSETRPTDGFLYGRGRELGLVRISQRRMDAA